jgi:hypothetical protein
MTFRQEKLMKTAKLIAMGAALAIAASSAFASTSYEVDEDRDGRADRTLILEQSDSLA